MIYLSLIVAFVALIKYGWTLTSRDGYESAAYEVVEADGPFEIRDYPRLTMATTEMRFASQGGDGSFMRLFRYISGDNDDQQSLAMTTPVFMQPSSDERPGQMGFVVPSAVAAGQVPQPSDGAVEIDQRDSGRFAVVRFAGRIEPGSTAEAEEKLRTWMSKRGLVAAGAAEFAGYDPPWTPGRWRRNEVLIRLRLSDR